MPRVFRYNTATDKHKGRIITRRVLLRSAFALAALVFGSLVVAHSVNAVTSLSQGYLTTGDIPIGSVVALEKNSTDSVAAASTETTDGIIGVAINDGSSLLTLNNGGKASVQVATNGVTPTIVSDCNGKIEPGDQITASPLKGVGMKATANAKVVGTAQGTMTGTDKQKVEGAVCENTEVTLGQVPVLVSISYHYRQPEKTIIPASLQNLANTVAGKKVSTLPVILSSALFIVTIIVVSVIIYSIIRSSIISIGQNPSLNLAIYYRLGDTLTLTPPAIAGFTTPSPADITIGATGATHTFVYAAASTPSSLAPTGSSNLPLIVSTLALLMSGSLVIVAKNRLARR